MGDAVDDKSLELDPATDYLDSFYYTLELDSRATNYGRDTIRNVYDYLVSQHGEPGAVKTGLEEMTVAGALEKDPLVTGSTYTEEWLRSKEPYMFSEASAERFPKLIDREYNHYYLYLRLEAEAGVLTTAVTVRYTIYASVASRLA